MPAALLLLAALGVSGGRHREGGGRHREGGVGGTEPRPVRRLESGCGGGDGVPRGPGAARSRGGGGVPAGVPSRLGMGVSRRPHATPRGMEGGSRCFWGAAPPRLKSHPLYIYRVTEECKNSPPEIRPGGAVGGSRRVGGE